MSAERRVRVLAGSPTEEELAALAVALGDVPASRSRPPADTAGNAGEPAPAAGASVPVVLRPRAPSLWARAGRWEALRGRGSASRWDVPGG